MKMRPTPLLLKQFNMAISYNKKIFTRDTSAKIPPISVFIEETVQFLIITVNATFIAINPP